jgi:hypothetical protein
MTGAEKEKTMFDVYVPGIGKYLEDVLLAEASAFKHKLHSQGVYCVYVCEAGTYNYVDPIR